MPGFNIAGANSARQKSNITEIRRKFRWAWTQLGQVLGPRDLVYLQSCQRPAFNLEENEMHHNQEVVYFAGKQTWNEMSFTFYDAELDPDVSSRLASWITTVVTSWSTGAAETSVARPSAYKADGTLEMLDGAGAPTERWRIYGIWPKETNWGDLDYTDNSLALVEVTARIDRAIKESLTTDNANPGITQEAQDTPGAQRDAAGL